MREPTGERSTLRILLAEDDAVFRSCVASALRDEGHEVIEVANGAALRAALEGPDRTALDLVVADVRMPFYSGLDILAREHARGSDLPFILVTAFAEEAVLTRARSLGAWFVLSKPFDIDDLRIIVRFVPIAAGSKRGWDR